MLYDSYQFDGSIFVDEEVPLEAYFGLKFSRCCLSSIFGFNIQPYYTGSFFRLLDPKVISTQLRYTVTFHGKCYKNANTNIGYEFFLRGSPNGNSTHPYWLKVTL